MMAATVTTAGWFFIVAWIVGGLGVGVAFGVWQRREGEDAYGLAAFAAWALAPLVVAFALIGALVSLLHLLVAATDDRVAEARPSRERLEARIAELERDLEMGPV